MGPEACLQLIEANFPQVEIRIVRAIDIGWDYFVLDVNDELIFRFPRRADVRVQLAWEMEILPMLARVLPVDVPRFEYVATDAPGGPPTFAGYPKIQGSPLDAQRLEEHGVRAHVARDIGEALSALHSIPLKGLSDHPMSQNPAPKSAAGWLDSYSSLFEFARRDVFPLLSPRAVRREEETWRHFLDDDSNFEFAPALVHQDLDGGHILTDYAMGAVVGIIDWGDCGLGDPALDFVGLLRGLGEGFVAEVMGCYRHQDSGIINRARFYGLVVPYHDIWYELKSGKVGYLERGAAEIESRWAS